VEPGGVPAPPQVPLRLVVLATPTHQPRPWPQYGWLHGPPGESVLDRRVGLVWAVAGGLAQFCAWHGPGMGR